MWITGPPEGVFSSLAVPGLSLRVDVDTVDAKGAIHQIRNEESKAKP